MRLVTVVGARPQFVKAGVVSRALRGVPGVQEVLVHTGQHYDENMSDVFFRELGLREPDFHLGIGSGSHGAQTGRMIEAIEAVLLREMPDWLLVYGDTNSTLAGAVAAAKLHVPVAHVEAGLRSFNRRMPEEINRVLTDHVSQLLFAPTRVAVDNLVREGLDPARIHMVGDVMYDAALHYGEIASRESSCPAALELSSGEYVLATIHRAENTDDPARLRAVFEGLVRVAEDAPVVLPLHPRTRAALERTGMREEIADALRMIPPVGYLDMIALEIGARLIVTDSGGVQKEAYFHGVPCVTLRDETEWVELVSAGWNRLVPPTDAESVAAGIRDALREEVPSAADALYGGGDAGEQIADLLCGAGAR